MSLQNIIDGWRNYLASDQLATQVAVERSKCCTGCDQLKEGGVIVQLIDDKIKEIQGYKCGACGCPLSTLLRDLSSECHHPEGSKWQKHPTPTKQANGKVIEIKSHRDGGTD